jgi:hypothetical protein
MQVGYGQDFFDLFIGKPDGCGEAFWVEKSDAISRASKKKSVLDKPIKKTF